VLIASAIAFVLLGVIPTWFFVLLTVRLLVFAVAMGALRLYQGTVEAESTFLGKAAVFAAMGTLAFQLCRYLDVPYLGHPRLVAGVEIACAVMLVASMADKAVYLRRKFSGAARSRGADQRSDR
jgi:phosphatidylglycerophosphate synthase